MSFCILLKNLGDIEEIGKFPEKEVNTVATDELIPLWTGHSQPWYWPYWVRPEKVDDILKTSNQFSR